MKTKKVSTLRANGFSVFNTTGNLCVLSHDRIFTYGGKPAIFQQNQTYRFRISGQFMIDLPKEVVQEKEK